MDTTDAIAFLNATSDDRHRQLRALGLGRFAPLLAALPQTPGNVACVARFFNHPSRVKFPDLRGADLAGLNLAGANLIRARLDRANLRGARLQEADLLFANLSAADVSAADLRGATLDETIWQGAIVEGCNLRGTRGLSAELRQTLVAGGAIVGDRP